MTDAERIAELERRLDALLGQLAMLLCCLVREDVFTGEQVERFIALQSGVLQRAECLPDLTSESHAAADATHAVLGRLRHLLEQARVKDIRPAPYRLRSYDGTG